MSDEQVLEGVVKRKREAEVSLCAWLVLRSTTHQNDVSGVSAGRGKYFGRPLVFVSIISLTWTRIPTMILKLRLQTVLTLCLPVIAFIVGRWYSAGKRESIYDRGEVRPNQHSWPS
jgi:phage shock protein PspC (stress-responsive transcriptional regulator)